MMNIPHPPTTMRPFRSILAALLLAQAAGAVQAADWQLVLSDRNRRVEIDRGSILTSDGGTKISWGRVVLTTEEARASGYAMIKALNRYDCRKRSFTTIKRVYVDAFDNIVREESVADQTFLEVARGSVDERMWREVCEPPSAADLQKLASEAASAAAARQDGSATAVAPVAKPAAPAQAKPPVAEGAGAAGRERAGSIAAAPETPPAALKTAAVPTDRGEVVPAFETHVEIPAKFLPGGQGAAADSAPRTSILPPIPTLAAKAERPPEPPATQAVRPQPQVATPSKESGPVTAVSVVSPAETRKPPAPPPAGAPSAPARKAVAVSRQGSPALSARARDVALAAPRSPAVRRDAAAVPAEQDAIADLLARQAIRLSAVGEGEPGWSYAGETGPEHWGRLRPEWRVCEEGRRQSPIDLRDGLAVDLEPVRFHYHRSGFRIRDTGNLLQVDVGNGMGVIVRGVRYELERFTLHRPSQDRVGGMAHDMAAYLEHRSADGRQMILSVLLSAGGEEHPLFRTLWANLPLDRGRAFTPEAVIDLATMVPQDPGHFLYTGSLPTPPCTEDVLWVVMKTPVRISDAQLDVFARLYPRNGRPIQPDNGRLVLESR